MIIGVPKEIKQSENRVALTPAGVMEFVSRGHQVYVQTNAGEGSGFPNDEYETAGAKILPTIEDVYAIAEMIIKVKGTNRKGIQFNQTQPIVVYVFPLCFI
jgi:alanine dehydrogenase